MRPQQLGFQKPPAVKSNPEFEANRVANSGHVEDLPDFDQLMQSSNSEKNKELEKEKAASANGQLNLGETKSDKEFKDMLEKITGKKQEKVKNKLDKDDYLNLMVTQLKHQDPTKPMDNQAMAQQLAQFNTVEQLISANQTLNQMANSQAEAKVEKLSPFLGKNVQVAGNKVRISEEGQISNSHYDIPEDAGTVTFTIKDSAGKTVRTDSNTMTKKGEHIYKWDGRDDKGNRMAGGEYTLSVTATTTDGKPQKASQTFTAKVTEITDLASGGKLGTTVGTIETKDILAIKAAEDEKNSIATLVDKNEPKHPEKIVEVAQQEKPQSTQDPATQTAAEKPAEKKNVEKEPSAAERFAEHRARRKAAESKNPVAEKESVLNKKKA